MATEYISTHKGTEFLSAWKYKQNSTYVFRQLRPLGTSERSNSLTLQLSRCTAPLDPINKPEGQSVFVSVGGRQLMSNHGSAGHSA